MKEEEIHIGSIIKDYLKENRISDSELAIKINTSRQNIQNILKKKSIDTDRLKKISKELSHDFFQYYQIDKKQGFVDNENKITEASAKFIIQVEITGDEIMQMGIKEKIMSVLNNK